MCCYGFLNYLDLCFFCNNILTTTTTTNTAHPANTIWLKVQRVGSVMTGEGETLLFPSDTGTLGDGSLGIADLLGDVLLDDEPPLEDELPSEDPDVGVSVDVGVAVGGVGGLDVAPIPVHCELVGI